MKALFIPLGLVLLTIQSCRKQPVVNTPVVKVLHFHLTDSTINALKYTGQWVTEHYALDRDIEVTHYVDSEIVVYQTDSFKLLPRNPGVYFKSTSSGMPYVLYLYDIAIKITLRTGGSVAYPETTSISGYKL